MAEVVVNGRGGLAQEIKTGRHTLRADEPVEAGGTDTGPNPYELLLAALGACTAITLRLYADRKGWPLEAVDVVLSHKRVHARDCRECETREGRVDHITKQLTLRGPLDDEQRQRLAEIAARCPVHQTLTHEIHIQQVLEPAGGPTAAVVPKD